MIIVLAGNAPFGVQVGRALGSRLPHVAVLRPEAFLPVVIQSIHPSAANGDEPDPPWLAGALAVSAQSIAAHGGTSVVVLPKPDNAPSVLMACEQLTVPLYLFLFRKPDRLQGVLRRAELLQSDGVDGETSAREVLACIAQGKGLIRPAPTGTGKESLLPTDGGSRTGIDII